MDSIPAPKITSFYSKNFLLIKSQKGDQPLQEFIVQSMQIEGSFILGFEIYLELS